MSFCRGLLFLAALGFSVPGWTAPGLAPPDFSATAAELAPPALFEPALRDDTDALLLPGTHRPPHRPTVIAATRVRARAQALAAVLLNPTLMREALPALVRADVLETRPGPRPDAWPDRLIAWELEIPLFNLTGKGWLRQQGGAVELTLVEGAFSPGHVRFRFAPATDGGTTVVTCEIQIDAQSSNWIFRRVARHDPWSETALSAATAWVLLRAVALRAEASPGTPPARPHAPIQPPIANTLDGTMLASPALAQLRGGGTLATVRRAANGRLAWASVVVSVPGSPTAAAARLGTPETWRVFPGWKSIKRASTRAVLGASPNVTLIEVDDNVAFVDLDATWAVPPISRRERPRSTARYAGRFLAGTPVQATAPIHRWPCCPCTHTSTPRDSSSAG